MSNKRFIKNKYSDSINVEEAKSQIKQKLTKSFGEVDGIFYKISRKKIYSDGRKYIDPSIYTGTGGISYIYWKMLNYYNSIKESKDKLNHIEERFLDSLNYNLDLVNKGDHEETHVSFFVSSCGLYTLGALYYKDRDQEKCKEMIQHVRDKLGLCFNEESSEYEVLNGNAGFLFCLLMLQKYCNADLKVEIELIVKDLVKNGLQFSKNNDYMLIKWPKNRSSEKLYIGGGHGIIGTLQMILQAFQIQPQLMENQQVKQVVQNTCEFILSQQLPSGNFPTTIGKKNDELVHFCHGSSGSIPMLLNAYNIFNDKKYLQAAEKAGNLIWEKGLILKGNSLCHGITGNAYFLHSLYRSTNDKKWLSRAYSFSLASIDEQIQKECDHYEDPTRIIPGISDTPYSLMEGSSGDICLYSDFLLPDQSQVRFPGYEI